MRGKARRERRTHPSKERLACNAQCTTHACTVESGTPYPASLAAVYATPMPAGAITRLRLSMYPLALRFRPLTLACAGMATLHGSSHRKPHRKPAKPGSYWSPEQLAGEPTSDKSDIYR